ncbi:MAG: L-threonine 3-dehydrogenase [Ardenticatenales bacterium]
MTLPATMRAVRKLSPGEGLGMAEVPVPRPGPGDVLLKVTAASICGTDVHIYNWDAWSAGRIKPPVTLGHEFAGEVVALGPGVDDVPLGAAASGEGHILLDGARHVVPGQEHLAKDMEVIGIDRDGAFAEYVLVPRANLWLNDRSLAPEIASLQDPFGNAVHTVHAQDVAGKTVLITGGGGLIGLMAIPVARVAGAAAVYVTDVNVSRLAVATAMGADLALDARDDATARILAATDGAGVDVLLEMSGNARAIDQGFGALRPGGEAAVLGLPSGTIEVDWASHIVLKGATVRGIYGRRIWETWYRMRRLLESGAVDLRPLISHRFGLDDFQAAFDAMRSGESCKVILLP